MSRLTEREQAVWDKRNAGLTFKQIAEELGLCPATVSFAYRKAYRKIEYGKAERKVENLKKGLRESFTKEFQDLIKEHEELAIYKRALEMACLTIGEWEQVSATNEGQIKYFLQEARKELENDI